MRSVPAAHSMDTTWFALDADGLVASFATGEAGALPAGAAASPEGGDFDDWPLSLVLVARALAEGTFPDEEPDLPLPSYPQRVALVLRPDADERPTSYRDAAGRGYSVHERLGDGFLVVRDAAPRVAGSVGAIDPARVAALAADAGVARVIVDDEVHYWCEDGGGALFRFANEDYEVPGAYVRRVAPIDPLDAGSLPPELAERLGALVLDVRFADTPALQLADHLDEKACHVWGELPLRGAPEGGEPTEAAPVAKDAGPSARRRVAVIAAIVALVALVAVLWVWLRSR
ncbi:MAG: hypothetical protein KF729_25350 [Sandaracinaceae bacterium]|nr:hypothetical protein [Sandaracinaceae bacterium]